MKDRVILYDNYIMYKGEKIYNKDQFFKYLYEERKNAKFKNVSLKCKDYYDIYTVRINEDCTEIVFPHMYEKENHEYEHMIEKWHRNDMKRNLGILKLAVLGTASIIALYKLAPYADDVFKNVGAYYNIKELENELDAHTGHNEIEGRKQSIQDHKAGYCALGEDLSTKEVYDAICDYCDEKKLGDNVASSAKERYELLLEDNMEDAYEIDLYDIYKETEKVKTIK